MLPSDKYQTGYSEISPKILDRAQRQLKAEKMLSVLRAGGLLRGSGIALDVGCAGGYFTSALVPHFDVVLGLDIDEPALQHARREHPAASLNFLLADSQGFPLADDSVDLVVCNHVYEHVPDSQALFDEILRVLRPGAACYLGAASRLTVFEPHYKLPFLSWLPKILADRYMRWAGKGARYYENLRTWWGIASLTRRFTVQDYTLQVIADPERYRARDLIPAGSWIERVPQWVWKRLYWLLPSYILLLWKPRT